MVRKQKLIMFNTLNFMASAFQGAHITLPYPMYTKF